MNFSKLSAPPFVNDDAIAICYVIDLEIFPVNVVHLNYIWKDVSKLNYCYKNKQKAKYIKVLFGFFISRKMKM